jgi:hypothetical protein
MEQQSFINKTTNMKKTTMIIMMTAMAVIFSMQVYSQAAETSKTKAADPKTSEQAKSTAGTFVDKNNNGVCDNFEARGKSGQGKNFADKNGDGKCDNCKGDCKGKGSGNCCGKAQGCGHSQQGNGNGNCSGKCEGNQHRHGCQGNSQPPAKPATDNRDKK